MYYKKELLTEKFLGLVSGAISGFVQLHISNNGNLWRTGLGASVFSSPQILGCVHTSILLCSVYTN